jgi:TolB protein
MNTNRVSAVRADWSRLRRSGAIRAWRAHLGVVALAAMMVAGCASSTGSTPLQGAWGNPVPTTPTTAPPAPAATAVADVPWSKVGPGWILATWNPATGHGPGAGSPGEWTAGMLTTTLYLIDPAGARYRITTFPPSGNGPYPRLVDWSGDGSHALFYLDGRKGRGSTVISVDLHTGTQTELTVDGEPSYTRPDGTAMLISTSDNGKETLKRIDLAGNPQFTYPTDLGDAGQFGGYYLESPDGTQLVVTTAKQGGQPGPRYGKNLVVIRNDGTVVRQLPSPMAGGECEPVKWWTPTAVLAHCSADSGGQLWQIPLDGTAPTAITAVNSGHGDDPGFQGDYGDGNAWQLPSGTFLQSAGACGSIFLSRLTPDKHTERVKPPGMDSSVLVVGATADRLLLQGKVGCGGTTSLVAYDPATNTDTVLVGPPVTGGAVVEALLYQGQK